MESDPQNEVYIKASGQLHDLPTLTLAKRPQYPPNRSLSFPAFAPNAVKRRRSHDLAEKGIRFFILKISV
jgi:hypothetical protein